MLFRSRALEQTVSNIVKNMIVILRRNSELRLQETDNVSGAVAEHNNKEGGRQPF